MPSARFARPALVGIAWMLAASPLAAQLTQEPAAQVLLNSARRAHNEKNYGFARDRFREFLQKHSGNKEANSAKYGLAVCLIDGREKDYPAAVEQLQSLAGAKEMPEHP